MTMAGKRKKKTTSMKKELKKIKCEPSPSRTETPTGNGELVLNIRMAEREGGQKGIKPGSRSWVVECPYCDGEYSDIKAHIKSKHKGKEYHGLKTQCPHCEKQVVDIINHIRHVHDKVKRFKCDDCEAVFVNSSVLRTHVHNVHQSVTTKCPHCDVTLKLHNLAGHIKTVHENRRRFIKCEAGCDKEYTSRADMQRHVLRVHLKCKTKCEFCEKEFPPDALPKHIKTAHQGIYRVYCRFCKKGFNRNQALEWHTASQHSGIFFQCNIPSLETEGKFCKMRQYTECGIKEHIQKHLAKDYKVLCQKCGTEIYSCYQQEHNARCHSTSAFPCDFEGCDVLITRREELKAHALESHAALMDYLEWCDLCNKPCLNKENHINNFHKDINDQEFTPLYRITIGLMCKEDGCKFFGMNKASINRHNKLVHNKPTLGVCELCNKVTKDMTKHMIDNHTAGKTFSCSQCDTKFQTKVQLQRHARVHTRIREECEICHNQVINLKQHMDQVHGNIRNFECDVEGCSQKFYTKLAKTKHQMHVHEGMRYKCGICGQEVVSIRSHMRFVHLKEKKHECPECGKKFSTFSHMRTHLTRVHLGVKDKCLECGKMVQDLKSHMLFVHKNGKNFPCDQCDKRFSLMSQLKEHIMLKHMTTDLKPETDELVEKSE